MNICKQPLIPMLIVLCLLLSAPEVITAEDSIQWETYETGISQGKKDQKKIFINFYAKWCTYCAVMDADTFKNQEIIDYLNKYFISIKVDMDREPETAARYFVRGLPTSWFLTENGHKISGLPGFIKPETFIQILKFIHSDSYKKMSFPDFLNIPKQ